MNHLPRPAKGLAMALAGVAAATWLGCGSAPSGPQLDPAAFPRAVKSLHKIAAEVIKAFEEGDPEAADRPLHNVGKAMASLKRLTPITGLSSDQVAATEAASEKVFDAFAELHEPMHQETFPEDFDFAPISEKLLSGLAELRAALPAEMTEGLAEIVQPAETTDEENAPDESAEATAPSPDAGAGTPAPVSARLVSHLTGHNPPLCPSVLMADDASWSSALPSIGRASERLRDAPPDSRWVQLVPTLHARLGTNLSVEAFGAMIDRSASWTDPANFVRVTDAANADDLSDRCREQFAAAIARAVRLGMHVAILPHIDPAGGPVVAWRNHYRLKPSNENKALQGDYATLLLEPIAEALLTEATADTRVDFALCGEMGRSLFEHPDEYADLLADLRRRFRANPKTAGVRLGVALNWSDVAGRNAPGAVRPDSEATQRLIKACDFVGVSLYTPVSLPPKAADFDRGLDGFLEELRSEGVEIPETVRLIVSEVGIGGGVADPPSTQPTLPTPESVAAEPWQGRGVSDYSPWSRPKLIALRRRYHTALLDWLSSERRVERAFLWSEGPWDPQGVADGRHEDPAIGEAIARHNAG